MSQFYKAEGHRRQARDWEEILLLGENGRKLIADKAERMMESYLHEPESIVTSREYKQHQHTKYTYSRSEKWYQDKITEELHLARKAEEEELERARSWIVNAFKLMKEYPCEHNLMCARNWISTSWKQYKTARKVVRGF